MKTNERACPTLPVARLVPLRTEVWTRSAWRRVASCCVTPRRNKKSECVELDRIKVLGTEFGRKQKKTTEIKSCLAGAQGIHRQNIFHFFNVIEIGILTYLPVLSIYKKIIKNNFFCFLFFCGRWEARNDKFCALVAGL